jgi:hypothetical protein
MNGGENNAVKFKLGTGNEPFGLRVAKWTGGSLGFKNTISILEIKNIGGFFSPFTRY